MRHVTCYAGGVSSDDVWRRVHLFDYGYPFAGCPVWNGLQEVQIQAYHCFVEIYRNHL